MALRELIERIADDGTTIMLIEHDTRLVMKVCQHLAVLDYGRKIAGGTPVEVQRDPAVLGQRLKAFSPIHVAITMEVGNVFSPRVDCHPSQREI